MLHLGTARTALFCWAYARHFGGAFILRIEDTDLERSTEEAVQVILDSMRWLGLDYDEGPVRQTHRLERYGRAIEQLLAEGKAYKCYASKEELETLREAQMARGEKPRYDGRWRPENGAGRTPPTGVAPVIRFRNPDDGDVGWNDLVKGPISISNRELDDLVIARGDGVPTYNFGVVVDDLDMNMTHVIRGDDHVNNTPRQINIYRALGAPLPAFAHVPMILGSDGERLSKRHGAVSVMQYEEDGYLPQALNNYLARLGWSHGNDEVFDLQQFVDWFDLEHISRSAAQFNPEKLLWLNQHYLKAMPDGELAVLLETRLAAAGIDFLAGPHLAAACALYKPRVATIEELADAVHPLYVEPRPAADLLAAHLSDAVRPALKDLAARLAGADWDAPNLSRTLKETVGAHGMKLPQLAIPLRVALLGQTQTPSIDAVLEVLGRERVLSRLERVL